MTKEQKIVDILLKAKTVWPYPVTETAKQIMALDDWVSVVTNEVEKATRKFPTWPTDPLHAIAVVGEEYGELNKDVLQMVYEPHKTSKERIREEAIQTAAMALRFLMSLDCYEYVPGKQHEQKNETDKD